MKLELRSTAFKHDAAIPQRFTEDGRNVSPPLTWSGVPAGTRELALIVDDPDAPTADPWIHWVIYKLPAGAAGLPENVETTERPAQPPGALQGRNSWSRFGYGGPAPPKNHGPHRYRFHLYALDVELHVEPGLRKRQLLDAMKGHILAEGLLVGTYER